MMRARILAIATLLLTSTTSYAGGPAFVAGSGYNPGIQGQPLIWANGSVQYFTDQGILSPILSGPQADAFVATAFATWTSDSRRRPNRDPSRSPRRRCQRQQHPDQR
jgi:hypothetical protein